MHLRRYSFHTISVPSTKLPVVSARDFGNHCNRLFKTATFAYGRVKRSFRFINSRIRLLYIVTEVIPRYLFGRLAMIYHYGGQRVIQRRRRRSPFAAGPARKQQRKTAIRFPNKLYKINGARYYTTTDVLNF